MVRFSLCGLLLLAIGLSFPADGRAGEKTISSGPADAVNIVVSVPMVLDKDTLRATVKMADGQKLLSQVTTTSGGKQELIVLVPKLKGGTPTTLAIDTKPPTLEARSSFRFIDEPGKPLDLVFENRKVLRYMNTPRDGATKDTHELTFKPFHHLFDPKTGETLLTNGAGLAANKELLFPHHRGLFFAFNRINTGDKQDSDTWHGRNGEYTLHEKQLATEAGELFGRQKAMLSWHGRDGKTFATEEREMIAYNVAGATMLDCNFQLKTDRPRIMLNGDPQHAGFHFRAAMEVSKTGKANTYYLRPDGKGKVGETRNWDAKGKEPKAVNLPWNAMSFVVAGQRYTIVRIPHPENPKDTRGSERDYGRFGDYFEFELTPKTPLMVRYRIWLQPGEMTVEECQALAAGFTQTTVLK